MDNTKKNLIGSATLFLTDFLNEEGEQMKEHTTKIVKNGKEVGSVTLSGLAVELGKINQEILSPFGIT